MKVALFIEDGREQIVLTPETDSERAIVEKLHDSKRTLSVYKGEFYSCQGGWTRQRDTSEPKDTIIVLDEKVAA